MACSHSGCHCEESPVTRGGHEFCSEACASAPTSGQPCPCGHAGCRGTGTEHEGRGTSRGTSPSTAEPERR
jgi:hypothetical protein